MLEALSELFNTQDYPARWFCGHWSAFAGWTHIISDVAIFLAYTGIPIAILLYMARLKEFHLNYIFALFSAFIFFCGATHLIEAYIFWWPTYNFLGLMKALTAIVSWATLIAIILLLPKSMALLRQKQKAKKLRFQLEKMSIKNKGLEDFADAIAHDLQEPLRNINTLIEMIQEKEQTKIKEEGYYEALKQSTKKMQKMIEGLHYFSKVSIDEFHLEKINLDDILAELQDEFATHEVPVHLEKVGTTQFICAHRSAITTLFQNLISNSIKYRLGDSVHITIHATEHDDHVELIYQDDGVGIEADELEHVFKLFYRGRNALHKSGSGMGLKIVKTIIEKHGGDIKIDSQRNLGTTFTIELPTTMYKHQVKVS